MSRMERSLLNQPDVYWARAAAEEVVRAFPDLPVYTVSSGISPSGEIHFGNFREIMTQHAVAEELRKMGKKVHFVFVWDEFDALRKIPAGVDPSWEAHLRKPLTSVPDPLGNYPSWAKRHEAAFEKSLAELDINVEFRYQTAVYESGAYDDAIVKALRERETIAKILLSHMSEKSKQAKEIDEADFIASYYPVSVFSSFTGKDTTEILSYDGDSMLAYRCQETGKEETISLRERHIVKLAWKTDWAMRWADMGVNFESAGKDHLSPDGSYDVSQDIVKSVYGTEAPLSLAYEFIGIRGLGAKMSGSKGNAVTPGALMEIYETPLLLWLYFRKQPFQRFDLAFDSEILRQYAELDAEVEKLRAGKLSEPDVEALRLAGADTLSNKLIPFRQAIAFGQIVQWDVDKVVYMLESLDLHYDRASVESRLKKAQAYLEKHHPEDAVALLGETNRFYRSNMSHDRLGLISKLREVLSNGEDDIAKLEVLMYDIPKREGMSEEEKKKAQRDFFKDVYQLLIGKDTGPRLSTFLWATDRERVLGLLQTDL
ncbi:TPA: lysine--tRNA ligase [Candidatus Uhrbacteria bacterium]|nr:lysine--tRNA ligase [Candidatus Uhrbacteria bacterium]